MTHARAFALSAIFGVVVLTVLVFYGDAPQLLATAQDYPLPLLVPVLLLTTANYALRWVKWRYYLHLVGAPQVRPTDSVLVFLSGFAMGLTPAKVGEMVKPYLLRDRYAIPVSRTTPILFAERLTDGIALIGLASAGILVYGTGLAAMVVFLGVAVAAVIVVRSTRANRLLLGIAGRIPIVRTKVEVLTALLASAATLLAWRPLTIGIALGVVSWGCEALAFFVILAGLGVASTLTLLMQATFALASATIFGSVSLLPGGLGVAEASLTGFLQLVVGLERVPAVYATLVIRVCTLWFGVGLGSLALLTLMIRRPATGEPVSVPLVRPSGRG